MTFVRIYAIRCDHHDCPFAANIPGEVDLRQAEQQIRKGGWSVRNQKHYCPRHAGTQAGAS